MVFGLMTKLSQSVKNFETCLNLIARPNIIELKNYIELVSKLNTRGPILDRVTTLFQNSAHDLLTCAVIKGVI